VPARRPGRGPSPGVRSRVRSVERPGAAQLQRRAGELDGAGLVPGPPCAGAVDLDTDGRFGAPARLDALDAFSERGLEDEALGGPARGGGLLAGTEGGPGADDCGLGLGVFAEADEGGPDQGVATPPLGVIEVVLLEPEGVGERCLAGAWRACDEDHAAVGLCREQITLAAVAV